MRRRTFTFLLVTLVALAAPATAFGHDQPETQQSRWVMADWMLDTFFILLSVILVGWAVVLIVGHLVWGQKF